MIKAGSFSRLLDFEECPLRAKFKYVDRIPEPDRGPPPKGKKEWPNDRGSRIHSEAEQFIKGELPTLPADLANFSIELHRARELYEQGRVETEEMWGFDKNWIPCASDDHKRVRFRIMADLKVDLEEGHALVVDFKTGKRWGNEVKHEQQKQTYALGLFRREPQLAKVTTELWYLDLPQEDVFSAVLTRSQGVVLLRALDARLKRMLEATHFPPRPSKFNCKFCPYREETCTHAVN